MALGNLQNAKKWKALIRKLAGKSEDVVFSIIRETGGTEDPNTGQWTPGVEEEAFIDGAATRYSKGLIDGVNIQSGDLQLIAAYDADIMIGDVIKVYGDKYTVIDPQPINPSGQVQIYKIQLRRQ